MDLNFYPDLSDGTGQHVDSEFMDNSSYNGYDSVNKVSLVSLFIYNDVYCCCINIPICTVPVKCLVMYSDVQNEYTSLILHLY